MKTDYDKCRDMLNNFNDNYLEKVWTAKIGKNGEMIVYREHAKVFLFNTYEIGLFDFGDNTGDEDLAILKFLNDIRAEILSDEN